MIKALRYICLCAFLCTTSFLQSQDVIPDEVIIDYSGIDKTLREVLFDISSISGVTIAFQEEIMPGDSIINFNVRQQEIGVIINYLLDRHSVEYKIVGDQIVLFKNRYRRKDEKVTVSGYLTDLETGEVLISANVFLSDQSAGTVSNEYGFYSLTIPSDKQNLYYSYLGYMTDIRELSLRYDTIVNVKLDPNNLLEEVVITDKKIVKPFDQAEMFQNASLNILPLERINSSLPVGGEPDILRLAYTMPGVTTGADGFGGLSVRGGSTDQNLILFDGIPVYNSNHLFGLFSIFNSNVVKSAKLYKGAFPSHYSGRLSSVLDIRTRDGNNQRFSGDISLGLLTAKASIEGPIIKDKASFLLSARRTTVDAWINSFNNLINNDPLTNRDTDISFYDLNAKLNFNVGANSKVHFSFYQGSDNFDNSLTTQTSDLQFSDLDELNWQSGNRLLSARWNGRLNAKSFFNVTAYRSSYDFASFDHDRVDQFDPGGAFVQTNFDAGFYETKINDLGFRLDIDIDPNPKHKLKVGGGFINHNFKPRFVFTQDEDDLIPAEQTLTKSDLDTDVESLNISGTEIDVFIEDEIKINKHTSLNLGYNQMIVSTGKTFFIPQPRVLFKTGSENYTFKMSWGRMGQFLHSLSNTGLGVPSDIWLTSTDRLPPEISWTATIGQFYKTKNQTVIGMEAFYKRLKNVTRYGTGILRLEEGTDWEDDIPLGTGTSYGLETSVSNNVGKTNIVGSYTWSRSTRQFDEINQGQSIRFRYDRRHVINFSLIHKLNENVEFSTNWEYGSGTPFTLPSRSSYNYIDESGNLVEIRVFDSELNSDEFPDYHRLDLGFNFYSDYKWGKTKLTLGVYNVYGRVNPLYIDEFVNADLTTEYQQFFLFKFLPTFSYGISF